MKLFKFFSKQRKELDVDMIRNLSEFGNIEITLEKALELKIEELESKLKRVASYMNNTNLIAEVIPDSRLEITKKLAQHFKEKGFTVDIYQNTEIKDFHIFIIGW